MSGEHRRSSVDGLSIGPTAAPLLNACVRAQLEARRCCHSCVGGSPRVNLTPARRRSVRQAFAAIRKFLGRQAGVAVAQPQTVFHTVGDRADGRPPHCGGSSGAAAHRVAGSPPQCGSSPEGRDLVDLGPEAPAPQCGKHPVERVAEALTAVAQTWSQAAEALIYADLGPKEAAIEFRRCLQRQSELVGFAIPSRWVRAAYPLFCLAQGVVSPPPYKDFAKRPLLMPRSRRDLQGAPRCPWQRRARYVHLLLGA